MVWLYKKSSLKMQHCLVCKGTCIWYTLRATLIAGVRNTPPAMRNISMPWVARAQPASFVCDEHICAVGLGSHASFALEPGCILRCLSTGLLLPGSKVIVVKQLGKEDQVGKVHEK